MIGSFKPAPATMSGPRVVRDVQPVKRGEVEVAAVGSRVTPERHAEQLRKAEERARNRPR